MILKRVGVLSVGKILGGIYAGMGLLVGGILAVISVLGVAMSGDGDNLLPGAGMGIAAVILAPLIYGTLGFLLGLLVALLYNLFAGLLGGVELELE